jgi:hypothetical protein
VWPHALAPFSTSSCAKRPANAELNVQGTGNDAEVHVQSTGNEAVQEYSSEHQKGSHGSKECTFQPSDDPSQQKSRSEYATARLQRKPMQRQ